MATTKKSTWARNTVTGAMAEFADGEYENVDPNQWALVEGYPPNEETAPKPAAKRTAKPATPRAVAKAAVEQAGVPAAPDGE
jgi:hypothetical protein